MEGGSRNLLKRLLLPVLLATKVMQFREQETGLYFFPPAHTVFYQESENNSINSAI